MKHEQVQREDQHGDSKSPGVSEEEGLSESEAAKRLAQYGENVLAEHRVSLLDRLAHFFWGPIPWMIEIAAILSAILQQWADLAIILTMLFVNAGVGFWQEFQGRQRDRVAKAAARAAGQGSSRWRMEGHRSEASRSW